MNYNNDQPLVSVLMTAYNREKYIAEAIESVLASSYKNFELIIVDDVSTDNTLSIAKKYEQKDDRIKVYQNEKNLKDYPNRNMAASFAKGKYLKYLDSDDKIFNSGLEYCVIQMEKFPEASIGLLLLYKEITNEDSICLSSEEIINRHFFERSYLSIGPSGTIIRRDKFQEIKGFDTKFGVASDNYFNIKMAALNPTVLLHKEFFSYRVHDKQEKNIRNDYLLNNYLLSDQLFKAKILPLKAEDKKYLFDRANKEFAKGLLRLFVKEGKFSQVFRFAKEAKFTFVNFLLSVFNRG